MALVNRRKGSGQGTRSARQVRRDARRGERIREEVERERRLQDVELDSRLDRHQAVLRETS